MHEDSRIHPWIEVGRGELRNLIDGAIAKVERIQGGLTNTLHRVTLEDGERVAIKHYAGGRNGFDTELVTLTLLHGTVPVPEILKVDDDQLAIVYRWIDGITLNDLRHHQPAAFVGLAEPIGRALASLSHTDATEPYELTQLLETAYRQLTQKGRTRDRLGGVLADEIRRAIEAAEPRLAWGTVCLVHGDFGGRNLIVDRDTPDRWRIAGVIDWEATTTGSPLQDIGSLFRYAHRYDEPFRAAFERGYRAGGGDLPDNWLLTARLLDALWLVDMLDDEADLPSVYKDCRMLLGKIAADVEH